MGPFTFTSWGILMALTIVFATLWGLYRKEWKGVSFKSLYYYDYFIIDNNYIFIYNRYKRIIINYVPPQNIIAKFDAVKKFNNR